MLFALPQISGSTEAATSNGTWKQDSKGKWFSYPDGSYARNTWLLDNAKWYHFDSKGYMQTGWLTIGGKTYYLGTDGVMVTGTVSIDGKTYNFDSNGVMIQVNTGSAVGEIFRFGSYEQDNNTGNGKEPIEWIVLEKRSDGTLFLLSRYALDDKQYNTDTSATSWEKCTSRKWLNGDFYNAAFSAAEKAKIQTTTVVNEANPFTGASGGKNTSDKIFLLSYSEVKKFFGDSTLSSQGYSVNPRAACSPTPYAKTQNIYTMNLSSHYYADDIKQYSGNCWWWLRTPGTDTKRAMYVSNFGDAGYGNFYVYNCDAGLRPAMVIKP